MHISRPQMHTIKKQLRDNNDWLWIGSRIVSHPVDKTTLKNETSGNDERTSSRMILEKMKPGEKWTEWNRGLIRKNTNTKLFKQLSKIPVTWKFDTIKNFIQIWQEFSHLIFRWNFSIFLCPIFRKILVAFPEFPKINLFF